MNSSQPLGSTLAAPPDPQQLLNYYIEFKKSTRGLTPKSEKNFRWTLSKFIEWLVSKKVVDLTRISTNEIVEFLGRYNDKPQSKDTFYRSLKLFYKWISATYHVSNPFHDEFGNALIHPPKLPQKELPTMDPDTAFNLMMEVLHESVRNFVIISLLMDSGARLSELANIQVDDLDLDNCRIRTVGKGGKESWLIFGSRTRSFLKGYLDESKPTGSLFGLGSGGIKTMLRRLEEKTGVKCNAHTFRRGFATELRKKGLNELDISELGRWNSTAMVKRYTRAFKFEDATARYRDII